MERKRLELLHGILDIMVLQTLAALGSPHGYGIARRIEQLSGDEVLRKQGTIYPALVRLQQRGWISAEWGVSDNNRKGFTRSPAAAINNWRGRPLTGAG